MSESMIFTTTTRIGQFMFNIPEIKQVIFNPPATVVIWSDDKKTVVKCKAGEKFDREKGLALCVMKRALGDGYKKAFHKWIPAIEAKKEIVPRTFLTCFNCKYFLSDTGPCARAACMLQARINGSRQEVKRDENARDD